ncbi:MAG: GYD domain-containing protein [candidate division Zixibacteria bacterium]|nr:GYD domain-containing protein [candidate division Zixibacteria bacterium]
MALFIMAMSINPGAKKTHRDLSHQVDNSLELFNKHHAKVKNIFATLGRYDYLALFEADDQTTAFRVASEINTLGILDTETWPVIPYDDFSRLLP